MRLIVLAAGKGSRMEALGKDNPKCVLKIQKTTIIERLINQFKKYVVNNISILVGYKSEKIKKIIGNNYNYIFYENYKNTNNLHTLWHARNEIEEETIITFADLVVDDEIINKIVSDKNNFSVLVDSSGLRENTMYISHYNNQLRSISSTPKSEATGNFIGISKLKLNYKKQFIESMSLLLNKSSNYYYTMALNEMISRSLKINTIDIKGYFWTEIDTPSEYKSLLLKFKK